MHRLLPILLVTLAPALAQAQASEVTAAQVTDVPRVELTLRDRLDIQRTWQRSTRLRRTGSTLAGLSLLGLIGGGIAVAVTVPDCDDFEEPCLGGPGLAMLGVAAITVPIGVVGAIVGLRGVSLRNRLTRRFDLSPWMSLQGAGVRLQLDLPGPRGPDEEREVRQLEAEERATRGRRLRRAGWTMVGTTGGALAITGVALAAAPCDEFCSRSERFNRLGIAALAVGPALVAGAIMAARGHGPRRSARAHEPH